MSVLWWAWAMVMGIALWAVGIDLVGMIVEALAKAGL